MINWVLTDIVSITSINQDRDLLDDSRYETVEGLHPVTLEQEVSVDVKVARIVAADFGSERLHDIFSVKILGDIAEGRVTEVVGILALSADVIYVLAGSLVWTNHSIVAVDACWDTRPNALAVIAALDETLAARKSIVHSLTLARIENSGVPAISACHWSVVFILGQAISETVTDKDGLQVDVALLVGENLGCENRDVVTSIGFSGNVEVLLGIFWELLEEEREESVHIFSSSDCVADRTTAV